MKKYRKYDCPVLLEQFEQSGLTQAQFCKDNNLNPRYFSLQRSKRLRKSDTRFTEIKIANEALMEFRLQVGRCQILCPATIPLQSLATLVHTLA